MNVGPLELLIILGVLLLPISAYVRRRWGKHLIKPFSLLWEVGQVRRLIFWSLVAFLLLPLLPSTQAVKVAYLLAIPLNALGLSLLNSALERGSQALATNAVLLLLAYNALALAGILLYGDSGDSRQVSAAATDLIDAFGLIFQSTFLLYRLYRLYRLVWLQAVG